MNILIVDDEFYIVKNIVENVDWNKLGIQKQFTAYSAMQAKRILEGSEDIDILLTDIDMPRESGLDLVAWMRQNDIHPIVMVLTGHQKFSYAQEALNLHIFYYCLKPIEISDLEAKLLEVVTEAKKNRIIQKEALEIGLQMEEEASSDPIAVIKTFVKDHLDSPNLNRDAIAEAVHMNPDYMSHLFSQKTGKSLSSYIIDKRVSRAKKLLVNSSHSLQEISDMCGFSSASYFHRTFKKCCGVTPQTYRSDAK